MTSGRPRPSFSIVAPVLAVLAVGPVVGLVPAAAQSRMEAADSLFQAERWSAAEAAYRSIVAEDSTQAMAWYRLGRVYHATGRDEAALEALGAAARHGFGPLFIAFARARANVALGRESEAVAELRGAAESGFADVSAVTEDAGLEPLLDHPELEAVLARMERNVEPCLYSEQARQLDFWIGTWDVYDPRGQQVGVNEIERLLNGCALLESWTGRGGSSGKSLNFYDPQRETWRQVWVSDRGNVLDYRHGEYRDGAMRFEGTTIGEDGDTMRQKLTFEPVSPDTVRQVFEASQDGGQTWDTTWVGTYVRRSPVGSDDRSEGGSGGG